jgi:hypothetical protein
LRVANGKSGRMGHGGGKLFQESIQSPDTNVDAGDAGQGARPPAPKAGRAH